jgi:hypothetical protein
VRTIVAEFSAQAGGFKCFVVARSFVSSNLRSEEPMPAPTPCRVTGLLALV